MPIRTICPSCSRTGKAPDNAVGRKARCPACQHTYVLTDEHGHAGDDRGLVLDQGPKPAPRDDIYGLDPEAIEPPKRLPPRPPVAPSPAVAEKNAREGGQSPPVPMLVGGGIGAVLVVSLAAWGLGLFGGRKPAAEATKPDLAIQAAADTSSRPTPEAPAPGPVAIAAPAETTRGEISVAAMLLLDQPSPAEVAVEADLAAKARSGAAAVAASTPDAGRALTTAEIVEESEPSVALIKGKSSSGTGFLVGPGLVATNAHVVDDEFANDLEVRFVSADDGQNDPIRAVLLYEDPERDLAFLAVKTDLKPLRVAKSYTFKKGEDITVIGSPGIGDGQVLENAISRGVMSTKTKLNDKNFYQLSIAVNPGNSGGPVFDSTGRVIGVVTLKSTQQESTGFSIPVEELQAAIAKVGAQTPAEADKCRSRHRTNVAVKTLGGAGALMCLMIDLRKIDAMTKNPAVKEVLAKLEPAVDEFEKDVAPSLAAETKLLRQDMTLEPAVRGMVNEIAEGFAKLHNAINTKKYPDENQLHKLKQNYRRLVTGLSTSLKIEFPKEMMVAFDDHTVSQPNIVAIAPSNLGTRFQPRPPASSGPSTSRRSGIPSRSSTLRDRMQQRKRGR